MDWYRRLYASKIVTTSGHHKIRAQARSLPKLTHRHHPAGSPCGQRMCAVHTHLQPSCVLYVVHRQTHFLMHLPREIRNWT